LGPANRTLPDGVPDSYERLAASVGAAASQGHSGLKRLEEGGLFRSSDRSLRVLAFLAFAQHGIPVVFPARVGAPTRGMPTAHSAPPPSERLLAGERYVWSGNDGVQGKAIPPLHPVVPWAAARDASLYAALALIDALRVGRARDRRLAADELERLLAQPQRDAAWAQRVRLAS
jgi:hypothetical protein